MAVYETAPAVRPPTMVSDTDQDLLTRSVSLVVEAAGRKSNLSVKQRQRSYRLHWTCTAPSPYNAQLFRALASDPELDLTVHYREWVSASRPWQSNLAEGYKARGYDCVAGVDWHLLHVALKDRESFFVIGGWDHLTVGLLTLVLGLQGRRFAIWTDTPNLSRRRKPVFAWLRSAWLKWVFSRAFRIMGTGQPGVNALRAMGADEWKLVDFPYFIDVDLYTRTGDDSFSNPELPIRFISSGRLFNIHKGHDVALRALAEAKHTTPLPFEYIIVGTGPDENMLRHLAEQLGIDDQVKFLGWVEPDALIQLYGSAQVLIHPSPTHEPYGVAVIEAMAEGLPVLASDVTCAALDRVKPGINGYIHPAGNADILAEHIAIFLRHPEKIAQMSQKARETAEEWPIERAILIIRRDVLQIGSDNCRLSL